MNLSSPLPATRAEAKAAGLKFFQAARPCKYGHISARYVSGSCAECGRARSRNHYRQNRDERSAYQRKRKAENPYRVQLQNYAAHLKRAYGITLTDYDTRLQQQGNKCAICGTDEIGGKQSQRFWCVDHNHEDGRVRGLLCQPCNIMLGRSGENPTTLLSAIDYLAGHQAPPISAASAVLSMGS